MLPLRLIFNQLRLIKSLTWVLMLIQVQDYLSKWLLFIAVYHYPMFLRFPYDNFNNDISYRLGNSYGVIYDATEKKE